MQNLQDLPTSSSSTSAVEEARRSAERLKDNARNTLDEGRTRAREMSRSAKEGFSEFRDSASKLFDTTPKTVATVGTLTLTLLIGFAAGILVAKATD